MSADDIIAVKVTGLYEVEREFNIIPGRLRTELRAAVGRAALRVQLRTKASKLSGQVLNVRTGRLRRSINVRMEDDSGIVAAHVGTNVEYAGAHEFGFSGVVSVREHLRRAKKAGGEVDWRENLRQAKTAGLMPWKGGRALQKDTKIFKVRAHSRKVEIPERSFLRSALADSRKDALAEIDGAIKRSVAPLA